MSDSRQTNNRLWSNSCIRAFECPWAWWQHYEEKKPGHPVSGFVTGSVLHKLMERYVNELVRTKQPRNLPYARQLIGTVDDRDARKSFRKYVERGPQIEPESIIGTELWYTADIPEDLGTYRGMIDLLARDDEYDQLVVTDYKRRWDYDEPDEDPTDQLRYYGWLVLAQKDFARYDSAHVVQVNLGSNTAFGWDVERPVSTRELVDAIKRILAERQWLAEPGPQCNYCKYVMSRDCHEVEMPEGWDDFRRQYGEMKRLEAEIKERKALLRAYVEQHGNQVVNGREWGKVQRDRYRVLGMKRLVNALNNDGEDMGEVLTLPKTQAEKLVKREPELYGELIEQYEVREWGEAAVPVVIADEEWDLTSEPPEDGEGDA